MAIGINDNNKNYKGKSNLSKRNPILLSEKIEIFERFFETGEELIGKTVFEGYPIGRWAIQLRNQIKRGDIKITEAQSKKLDYMGILDRQIGPTIDEKIDMLIEWRKKYPKLDILRIDLKKVLKEYSKTDKEYKELIEEIEKITEYYKYVRRRMSRNKLKKDQILKCKEGNIGGVFGYSDQIEDLSKKYGKSENDIFYIISVYKTMNNFLKLYRTGDLSGEDLVLAGSMINNVLDIDFNPNSDKYDNLYCKIMHKEMQDNRLELYSSKNLYDTISQKLNPNEKKVIEERFALLSDTLPKSLSNIASEMVMSAEWIRNLEAKALNKLRYYSNRKQYSYNLEKIKKEDLINENERNRIENLKDRLYESDILFNTNSKVDIISKENLKNDFEFIKNINSVIEERKRNDIENGNGIDISIEKLKLPGMICSSLQRAGVSALRDIAKLTEKELRKINRLQGRFGDAVISKIEEYGVTLREENIDDLESARVKKGVLQSQMEELQEEIREARKILDGYDKILDNGKEDGNIKKE